MKKEILSKVYELLQNYGFNEEDLKDAIEERKATIADLPRANRISNESFLHIYDETKEDRDGKISFDDVQKSIKNLEGITINGANVSSNYESPYSILNRNYIDTMVYQHNSLYAGES